MNIALHRAWLLFLALTFGSGLAQADFDPLGEKADAQKHRQVRIQLFYYQLSLEQSVALMSEPEVTKSDVKLHKRVLELATEKKAELIDHQLLVARSGEKATTESIQEYIYPTEYEPASFEATALEDSGGKDKKIEQGAPLATAFETRNIGSTVELEPTIGDDSKVVDIRIVPETTFFTKNLHYGKWSGNGKDVDVIMPVFYSARVTTAVTVIDGKPALLSLLSPKDAEGNVDNSKKIYVFLRADVVYAGE